LVTNEDYPKENEDEKFSEAIGNGTDICDRDVSGNGPVWLKVYVSLQSTLRC
jgi:hypothetical protein